MKNASCENVPFRMPVMLPTPHNRSFFKSTAKGNYASMVRAAINPAHLLPEFNSSAGQAIGTANLAWE